MGYFLTDYLPSFQIRTHCNDLILEVNDYCVVSDHCLHVDLDETFFLHVSTRIRWMLVDLNNCLAIKVYLLIDFSHLSLLIREDFSSGT